MKRTYKHVSVNSVSGKSILLLDSKPARTPIGAELVLPNAKLAKAIAEEWQSQKESIRKETMPLTQIACIAIDLATEKRDALVEELLAYAETDLVCYRAGTIPVLHKQQQELLSPVIAWAEHRFGIVLTLTDGLMPILQPANNKIILRTSIYEYDVWNLALLASITKPLGSLILALAFIQNHINAEQAFQLSHLEELYENGQWGEDSEKEAKMAKLRSEINAAGRFLSLL